MYYESMFLLNSVLINDRLVLLIIFNVTDSLISKFMNFNLYVNWMNMAID